MICRAKCGLKQFYQTKIQRMYVPFGPTTLIKNGVIPINPTNSIIVSNMYSSLLLKLLQKTKGTNKEFQKNPIKLTCNNLNLTSDHTYILFSSSNFSNLRL
jgi:hypothetical protein